MPQCRSLDLGLGTGLPQDDLGLVAARLGSLIEAKESAAEAKVAKEEAEAVKEADRKATVKAVREELASSSASSHRACCDLSSAQDCVAPERTL